MGNTQHPQFSTVTQSTFSPDRYAGMWFEVYNTSKVSRCDSTVVFCVPTKEVLNIVEYCVVGDHFDGKIERTAVAPNPYDPCKFVLRTSGTIGTPHYWIYYTDYTTYALIGFARPRKAGAGSDFAILSRSQRIPSGKFKEAWDKALNAGLTSDSPNTPE